MNSLFFAALAVTGIPLCFATGNGPPQADEPEIVRLSEWPALDSTLKSQVATDVARLRKARTPEMAEQAHEALIAVGAGAAVELLTALGKEKDEGVRASLTDVLDLVTGAAHTRLLAERFDDRSRNVRVYCMRRAAHFPDAGTRAAADKALEKAANPGKGKKPDADEWFAASLAATAGGGTQGIEKLLEVAKTDWGKEGELISASCTGARGADAAALLIPHLDSGERRAIVAALNMLGACGTLAETTRVGQLLDSDDTGIRIAAINALRGIVDGEPPIERLSAFDAIELAKKWKARI